MTSSRFFLARVALAFGISRRNQRMSDAAFETHLLREGEQILGAEAWEAAENIEELSAEYWNLRKLRHEREQLEPSLAEAEATLAEAHEERARLLNQATETQQKLEEERAALMKELEDAARKRDEIVAEAKGIRRIYEGLKMKLQVLAEESTGPETQQEIAKTRERIGELRQDFEELKKRRTEIGLRIEEGDRRLNEFDNVLGERRKVRREEASYVFQIIGDANRDISNYRAQIGLLDTREQQLFGEIGRYISLNARTDPHFAEIYKSSRGLINIMGLLRKSIIMNRRLAQDL